MLKGENYIRVLLHEMQTKQRLDEDALSFGEQDIEELTALIGEVDRIKQAERFIEQYATPDIRLQILEGQVIVSSTDRTSSQSSEDLLTIFEKLGTPEVIISPIAVSTATLEDVPTVVTLAWALGTFLDLDVSLFEVKR